MTDRDDPSSVADAATLNRTIFGGEDELPAAFLDDYDPARDPARTERREDLNVFDRYDRYLERFDFTTLSAADLGFAPGDVSADALNRDRNFTYAGDLYRNTFQEFEDGRSVNYPFAGAVALAATKPDGEGGETLHLTFRGTDADFGLDGEAATGAGQARYYRQLTPLIDQAYDYAADPANGVTGVVVSGHSLGGAMADLFAAYDGARFDALPNGDLQIVSLASAGIDPAVFALKRDFDAGVVRTGADGVTLDAPAYYRQFAHYADIVYFPGTYQPGRLAAADPGQAPITSAAVTLLRDNVHFGEGLTLLRTPTIDQYALARDEYDSNFLARHNDGLYELHLNALADSPLAGLGGAVPADPIFLTGDSRFLADVIDDNTLNNWGLNPNDVFDVARDDPGAGDGAFVLGLGGGDRIAGASAADALDGGDGADSLRGRGGNDVLAGGAGADVLLGDAGADILDGGGGADRLTGGPGADVFRPDADDTITDFTPGVDRREGGGASPAIAPPGVSLADLTEAFGAVG